MLAQTSGSGSIKDQEIASYRNSLSITSNFQSFGLITDGN